MNENHKRRIAITFQHIDSLLQEAVESLSASASDSPFSQIVPDAAPVQHRVIQDYAVRVRGLMVNALQRLEIPIRTPSVPATRSALTNFLGAEIDIEEIDPRRLNGYGALPPEDARILADTNAEIVTVLAQMSDYLRAGATASIESRLSRLKRPESFRSALQELTRIITDHGFVTLRPALERLVEEAESDHFEIAVFGRVSSGKSSLLNRVLGRDLLPVGVTPVTAIVTRIAHGPEERVVIRFATDQPVVTTIDALPAFVTEQGNPANRKHVASILVELTGDRIPEGVAFVDTPGLGSLASSGAEETMAYLPRANLGILLTDASSVPTAEDMRLVEGLLRAGARVMLVLSKADLLVPEDRQKMRNYVSTLLASEVGCEIPVHMVSVIGADACLADHWFESDLHPLVSAHREQKTQSLARKVESLRLNLLGMLRAKAGVGETTTEPLPILEQAFRQVEGRTERAWDECQALTRNLSVTEDQVLQRMVSAVPRGLTTAEVQNRLVEVVEAFVRETHDQIVRVVRDTREGMLQALGEAVITPGSHPNLLELPLPYGLPMFDGIPVVHPYQHQEPFFGFLHPEIRKSYLLVRLRQQILPSLSEALRFHRRCLDGWCREFLAELGREFQIRSGPFRVGQEVVFSREGLSLEAMEKLEGDIKALEALGDGDPTGGVP